MKTGQTKSVTSAATYKVNGASILMTETDLRIVWPQNTRTDSQLRKKPTSNKLVLHEGQSISIKSPPVRLGITETDKILFQT